MQSPLSIMHPMVNGTRRIFLNWLGAAAAWAVFSQGGLAPGPLWGAEAKLEMVFQLPLAPAGLTLTPQNLFLMSVNREERPQNRVIEVGKDGASRPYPTVEISQAAAGEVLFLDAIEGMQIDKQGMVWLLDSGRRSEIAPKVVAWDPGKSKLHRLYNLAVPAVQPGSLLKDIAVDPEFPFVYLSDQAGGMDAALVVLDLSTGLANRVLQGHPSVAPVSGLALEIDGQKIETRRLDGTVADPQGAVSSLALDRKGEWLYFGPVRSQKLYRMRTEHLRDFTISADRLAGLVEEYAAKPVSDGLSLDNKGNIYLGDLQAKGIGMISAGKKEYRVLATEPRLLWPAGLCFGENGWLYFYTNAARTRPAGRTSRLPASPAEPPGMNYLFRLQTPASGRVGD